MDTDRCIHDKSYQINQNQSFNGNFNGQDYSIRNKYIFRQLSFGTFQITEENAVIKNLYVYGNMKARTNDTYGIAAGICAVNYGFNISIYYQLCRNKRK